MFVGVGLLQATLATAVASPTAVLDFPSEGLGVELTPHPVDAWAVARVGNEGAAALSWDGGVRVEEVTWSPSVHDDILDFRGWANINDKFVFAYAQDDLVRVSDGSILTETVPNESGGWNRPKVMGDLDGDRAPDLVSRQTLRLSSSNYTPEVLEDSPYDLEVFAVGDLDGDGLDDMVTCPRTDLGYGGKRVDAELVVYRGVTDGSPVEVTRLFLDDHKAAWEVVPMTLPGEAHPVLMVLVADAGETTGGFGDAQIMQIIDPTSDTPSIRLGPEFSCISPVLQVAQDDADEVLLLGGLTGPTPTARQVPLDSLDPEAPERMWTLPFDHDFRDLDVMDLDGDGLFDVLMTTFSKPNDVWTNRVYLWLGSEPTNGTADTARPTGDTATTGDTSNTQLSTATGDTAESTPSQPEPDGCGCTTAPTTWASWAWLARR